MAMGWLEGVSPGAHRPRIVEHCRFVFLAQEGADRAECLFGLGHEIFESYLVVAVFEPASDVPGPAYRTPPVEGSRHSIARPPRLLRERRSDRPTIADDVDEGGVGEPPGKRVEMIDVRRGLIAPAGLAPSGGDGAEERVDEIRPRFGPVSVHCFHDSRGV